VKAVQAAIVDVLRTVEDEALCREPLPQFAHALDNLRLN